MKELADIDIMRTILAKIEKTIASLFAQKISITPVQYPKNAPLVSIIIVAYNALNELQNCVTSLQQTAYPNFEIVVVNNKSETNVKQYLDLAKRNGTVQRIIHSKNNLFFSGGNNVGVQHSSTKTEWLVLLNSDTVILDPHWLSVLLQAQSTNGIVAFGSAPLPFRPDGWCYLIQKKLYQKLAGIDTTFKMNWGVTNLTERAVTTGAPITVILNYGRFIRHLGERSYTVSGKHRTQNTNKPSFLALLRSPLWFKVRAIIV